MNLHLPYFLRAIWIVLFGAFLTTGTSAENETLDWETTRLIRNLGSSNEADRVEARQLLPREGVRVVPGILPLLGRPDAGVWWTAEKVLADIANQVSVPGREEELRFLTRQLMNLLSPETATEVKARALGLLAVAVPEGFDIQPIAALLADPDLRSNARDALQLIASAEAVAAIADALDSAAPELQIALLDSLDKMRRPEALPILRRCAANSEPNIRAAAARGVARWGELQDLNLLDQVWENRTPDTEFDAGEAYLIQTDSIAASGGNIGLAVERYRNIFLEAKDPVLVGAGMMGMARYGDSRVVEPIFSILVRPDSAELLPQFLLALEAIRGTGANRAVADRFDHIPANLRLPAIELMGRKAHPEFLPLLDRLADSESPEVRQAALTALARTRLPGSVDLLAKRLSGGDEALRALAVSGLIEVGEALALAGRGNDSGRAYAAVLDHAPDDESRKNALRALGRFPRAESFESVVASLKNPAIENEARTALIAVVHTLVQSSQVEKANQGFDLLIQHNAGSEQLQPMGSLAEALGRSGEWLANSGFITRWKLIGPFPWNPAEAFGIELVGEPDVDLSEEVVVGDRKLSWKEYDQPDSWGQINLSAAIGAMENASAYAYAEFEAPEAAPGEIRLGSDDWVKVWLNGEAVHESASFRGVALDQDRVPATFRKGKNTLLLRINQGVLGWGFVVRITDADGNPIVDR